MTGINLGVLHRKRELVRDVAMKIGFSADGSSDSVLGRAVKDAGLDNLMPIESDVKMLIRGRHKRYLR